MQYTTLALMSMKMLQLKKIKRLPKLIVPNAITEAKRVKREESANTLKSRRLRFYTVSRLNKIKIFEYVIQTLAEQNTSVN